MFQMVRVCPKGIQVTRNILDLKEELTVLVTLRGLSNLILGMVTLGILYFRVEYWINA